MALYRVTGKAVNVEVRDSEGRRHKNNVFSFFASLLKGQGALPRKEIEEIMELALNPLDANIPSVHRAKVGYYFNDMVRLGFLEEVGDGRRGSGPASRWRLDYERSMTGGSGAAPTSGPTNGRRRRTN